MTPDRPPASVPAIEGLFRLDGQVAVVTGGGGSIGRTASHVLSQAGAAVVVADRDREAAERVRAEIAAEGGQTAVREWDVTLEPVVAAGFGQVLEEYGRLDVLVNSVGGGKHVPAMEMSLADWNEVLTRNLTSTFLCCREAGRRMAAQGGGSIVNISSILGHSGGGLYPNSAYHASQRGGGEPDSGAGGGMGPPWSPGERDRSHLHRHAAGRVHSAHSRDADGHRGVHSPAAGRPNWRHGRCRALSRKLRILHGHGAQPVRGWGLVGSLNGVMK